MMKKDRAYLKSLYRTSKKEFEKGSRRISIRNLPKNFTQEDFKDVSAIADLPLLQKFFMRGVGLIHTTDLHFKMPSLEILDLQDNRIYERLYAIEYTCDKDFDNIGIE